MKAWSMLPLLLLGSSGGCDGAASDCRSDFDAAATVCPATYDAERAAMVCQGTTMLDQMTRMTYGLCASDGLLFMAKDMGMYGYTCFYDATTKQLVGESEFGDNEKFCNQTSITIRAGRVPAKGTTRTGCQDEQVELSDWVCPRPDGGADDGDGSSD